MAAPSKSVENVSNNNLIIIMMLITFLVVGISALVAKTLVANIILDNKVVSKEKTADDQLKADVDAAPKLVQAYNDLHGKANKLTDALPTTADFPSLIVEMENVGLASGMTMKSVTAAAVATDAAAGTVMATPSSDAILSPVPQNYAFSLSIEGSFDSLMRTLDHLETSARPMRVTGIQVNGNGKDLSGEIDVTTYYQDKAQLPFSKETVK